MKDSWQKTLPPNPNSSSAPLLTYVCGCRVLKRAGGELPVEMGWESSGLEREGRMFGGGREEERMKGSGKRQAQSLAEKFPRHKNFQQSSSSNGPREKHLTVVQGTRKDAPGARR